MDRFKLIDDKLKQFANRYKVEVYTKGSKFWIGHKLIFPNKLQERRILWVDELIGKAVVIVPSLVSKDIEASLWDFINLAWIEDEKSYPRGVPCWEKYLFQKVEFQEIENAIDLLLSQSAENLEAIKLEDLSLSPFT